MSISPPVKRIFPQRTCVLAFRRFELNPAIDVHSRGYGCVL
jgi:hypothetical protein